MKARKWVARDLKMSYSLPADILIKQINSGASVDMGEPTSGIFEGG